MDHLQATQLSAVEKYLLDELSPEMREEFEEHFFDCQECAVDLRVTAGFMDAARKELRANPEKASGPVIGFPPRSASFWPRVSALAALAACLLVIAYQNVVVFPRFETEIAELKAPEILPSLSLVGGNSRGGEVPALAVGTAKPFLLLLDIPTQDGYTGYICKLYSPTGSLVWQVVVSAQAAKDTVSIRVPSRGQAAGEYTLKIQGRGDKTGVADLTQLRFTLDSLK